MGLLSLFLGLVIRFNALVGGMIKRLALFVLVFHSYAIRTPIVVMHGILSNSKEMRPVKDFIDQYLPGTYVKLMEIGDGSWTSLENLQKQVDEFIVKVKADSRLSQGFHLICHSQGCLIGRAYVEQSNEPQVFSFISWAGPNAGYFGAPEHLDQRIADLDKLDAELYEVLYTPWGQKTFSVASYWKDPHHLREYCQDCKFLSELNNEVYHEKYGQYRDNICKLLYMVLVQSTNDEVIVPQASSHFGFYAPNSHTEIVPMEVTPTYKNLGLETLNEAGRLLRLWSTCTHTEFKADQTNFVQNTLPYLIDPFIWSPIPSHRMLFSSAIPLRDKEEEGNCCSSCSIQ